jgi:hypothetical protein
MDLVKVFLDDNVIKDGEIEAISSIVNSDALIETLTSAHNKNRLLTAS